MPGHRHFVSQPVKSVSQQQHVDNTLTLPSIDLLLLMHTMEFKRGDPIVVVGGSFAGKKGTFIELTGKQSGRVKLQRDNVESRTLRMTSLRPENYESDDDEEKVIISKEHYDLLVSDLEELQQQIEDMRDRVRQMGRKRKGGKKRK